MKAKMKEQIKKLASRKLVRSFIVIFTGQGLASILGLLAILFIVNGIGSEQHGIIVVTQTYGLMFYNFFSFKTFQGLIKYLTHSLKNKDYGHAKLYIKWSVILDIASLILTVVFGLVLMNLVIEWMGWSIEIKPFVTIYMIALLFNIQGSTIGVLRTFEKYNYVIFAQIVSSAVRMIGWGILFLLKGNLMQYFIIEIVATLTNNFMLIIYSFWTLKKNQLLDFYKQKLTFDKEFISFNIYSNLASTIDLPVNQLTQMIINKYLGFAANSIYSIFERLGQIINKLGEPINQIIYPEMNLLIADKEYERAKSISDKLKKLMACVFGVVAMLVLLTNQIWLGWFMENPTAYVFSFILYLAFVSYTNGTAGVHNLFLALGYIKFTIPIVLAVNVVYLIVIFFAVQNFGLNGVIVSYIFQAFAVVFIKEHILRRHKFTEYEKPVKIKKQKRRNKHA